MADFWLEASIEFTCFLHLKGDSDAHFASLFSTSRVHKTWRLLGPLNRKQSSRLRFGVNWLRLLSWSNWELQVGWRTLSTLSMHICMYLYLPISSHLPYLSLIRLSLHFLMLELSAVWHPQVLKMNECRVAFQFLKKIFLDWFIIVICAIWMFLRCARFYVLQSHRSSESRDFCSPRTRLWCFKAKVVTASRRKFWQKVMKLLVKKSNIFKQKKEITRYLLWH